MSGSDDDRIRRIKSRSLANPELKIKRAKKHLDSVQPEVERFYELNPPVLTEEEHLKEGEYWLCLDFPVPPPEACIIVGDFAHCLRSALDYLAYDLCIAGCGEINPKSQFPIFGKSTKRTDELFDQYTEGMPDTAKTFIRELQPYHGGNAYRDNPLWRLNKLAIIDKHHRIPLAGVRYSVGFFRPRFVIRHGSFNDRHGVIVVIPIKDKADFKLDPRIKVDVVLRYGGKPDGLDVTIDDLLDIYKFVCQQVIPRFSRFFTKSVGAS